MKDIISFTYISELNNQTLRKYKKDFLDKVTSPEIYKYFEGLVKKVNSVNQNGLHLCAIFNKEQCYEPKRLELALEIFPKYGEIDLMEIEPKTDRPIGIPFGINAIEFVGLLSFCRRDETSWEIPMAELERRKNLPGGDKIDTIRIYGSNPFENK